jgi:NAD-dependent SIR2 family protein deacetylase
LSSSSLSRVLHLINNARKIVVFTGAGISTNCGIPDFRSSDGIYALVEKEYNLPYPEAVFDISYFYREPGPFFQLSSHLFTSEVSPSLSHNFIAWLEEQSKLELVITQNIDMLHTRAGNSRVFQCHGTYTTATCTGCGKNFLLSDIEEDLKAGKPPRCPACTGIVKPDIVFFGEQLPARFYQLYDNPPESDLILVLGTSLSVQPAASLAVNLARKTTSIIINNEATDYDSLFTHVVRSDTDEFCESAWEYMKNGETGE